MVYRMDISFPLVIADAVVGISQFFTFIVISERLRTKKDWQVLP